MICNSRSESKGGGTAILLQNGINYKRRKDIEVFKEKCVESTIIEITAKDGKKIIVGSMYHPPNTDPTNFRITINMIWSNSLKEKKEIILGMDHNLDLLKSGTHRQTQLFFTDLLEKNIYPTITRPTRICQSTATLIDNIFMSRNLHKYFESAIILDDISDHLPLLVLLKQTKLLDNKPINVESRKLNENTIMLIKQKLFHVNWTRLLNATNCSENFDIFSSKLNKIMDSVSPLVKVKISAKRKYCEPWMTRGLEISSHCKLCLYKETLKATAMCKDITRYKEYRNMYNRIKRCLKLHYYQNKATEFINNSKKLWGILNEVIGKMKNKGSIIPFITVDGLKIHSPSRIFNEFGKFYSTIGESMASKITQGQHNIDYYLSKMPRNITSLVMRSTNISEIEHIIHKLPNKTSCGHDTISNTLLKQLSPSISFALNKIFNQSIAQGIFPDAVKLAEVIPLYKGKDQDQIVNY